MTSSDPSCRDDHYTDCGASRQFCRRRLSMRCPYCHVDNDRVLDTRSAEGGYVIRRKRVCNSCQRRFSTMEKVEHLHVRVVKREDTREPFDREKIRRGIERACSKRPVTSEQIEQVVQEIEGDIYAEFESEVPAAKIGEIVMYHLARLDEVAYIRFASVYRDFEGAEDFFRAITQIKGAQGGPPGPA